MQDHTPTNLIPLEPRREPSPLKSWMLVLGLIAALGTAGGTLVQWVNWPWETKADAATAHARLQDSVDAMRAEHKAGDERVIEAINKLGAQLGRRK